MRYLSLLLVGLFLITAGLWNISVSEETIKKAVRGALGNSPVGVEIEGLKKGLFYNLTAERITFKNREIEIFHIEDFSAKINPLYLFLLRHRSTFSGRVQEGAVKGEVNVSRKELLANVKIENVDIKGIPYLESKGLKGGGMLKGAVVIRNDNANLMFALDNAELKAFSFSGIPVPLEMFNSAKGMINIKGNELDIESLSLEGNGIYGRIKGSIKDNLADLNIEIMPDASSLDRFPILAFMDKYKVSPGYYVIPVKTKVSF